MVRGDDWEKPVVVFDPATCRKKASELPMAYTTEPLGLCHIGFVISDLLRTIKIGVLKTNILHQFQGDALA